MDGSWTPTGREAPCSTHYYSKDFGQDGMKCDEGAERSDTRHTYHMSPQGTPCMSHSLFPHPVNRGKRVYKAQGQGQSLTDPFILTHGLMLLEIASHWLAIGYSHEYGAILA
jgi:hypothetical protein